MKKLASLLSMFCLAAAVISCGDKPDPTPTPTPEPDPFEGYEHQTYTESSAIIPNPERGFYSTLEVHDASKSTLNSTKINVARNQGRTLFMLEYYLTDYMDGEIAQNYLDMVRTNFQALRDGGAKCLIRFAYKDGHEESDRPWDAPVDIVLGHVAQLKPLLQEYSDVIFCLQAGFVGSWGEWYYTDNFVMNPNKESDYEPRKRLLTALLDALPENRQVEVRTPTFKMKIYGYALADSLTAAEAHSNTIKARIAGHNDCFLASENDTGTYHSNTEKQYWQAETRYTIMGGESCAVSGYCHCKDSTSGKLPGAITTMEKYHFSYLHISYHPDVLKMWRTEKCFDEVDQRLGYRLVLKDAYFQPSPKAGEDYRVVVNLDNVGFAAPMNPRDAEFVLTDASGNLIQTYKVNSDPRTWHSNENIVLDQTIKLPQNVSGNLKLHLYLPDPETTLRNNSRFAIRLANDGVWDDATGYNLLKTITL